MSDNIRFRLVVIGGLFRRSEEIQSNAKGWELKSETGFADIKEIPGDLLTKSPSICYYDSNKLILTGGKYTDDCVMLHMSAKKWKNMKSLKVPKHGHASLCILHQLFIFGGDKSKKASVEWSTSVEYLNIEQEHGVWQSAPPMPSVLKCPKITNVDTSVYLMGDNSSVVYLFDEKEKVWSQISEVPQDPRMGFYGSPEGTW